MKSEVLLLDVGKGFTPRSGMNDFDILKSKIKMMSPDVRYVLFKMITDQSIVVQMLQMDTYHSMLKTPQGKEIKECLDLLAQLNCSSFMFKTVLKVFESTKDEDSKALFSAVAGAKIAQLIEDLIK